MNTNGPAETPAATKAPARALGRHGHHLLLLTRLGDQQLARLQEAVATNPKAVLSRDASAAAEVGQPVTAIIGGPPPELLEHLHHVEWVQLRADCLEAWCSCLHALHDRGVTVTRTCGSYNDTVPDHAMMLTLALARGVPTLVRRQQRHAWKDGELDTLILGGATMVVVGLGHIGREVAKRAEAFGLRVVAVDPQPESVPAAVQTVVPPAKLGEVVSEADILLLTVPAKADTVGLIGREMLARMKPTAYLVNVGRGAVVDTAALVEALDQDTIAGAALDVVDPSPLPDGHPLWDHPRVLLTCHTAQRGSRFAETQLGVILANVRRYVNGEDLLHVVQPGDW